MSEFEPIKVWFEARPEKNVIICHRSRSGNITYTRDGVHPAEWALDPETLKDWRAALEIMNWSK